MSSTDPPIQSRNHLDWDEHLSLISSIPQLCTSLKLALKVFPACSKYWLRLLSISPAEEQDTLFPLALSACPSPDLYRLYLSKISKLQDRDEIMACYAFAISQIGIDPAAADIWKDYISFIAAAPVEGVWAQQGKNDNLRAVYQRAVVVPHASTELLWRQYEQFELGLGKITAKKFLADLSPDFMQASGALKQLLGIVMPAKLFTPAVPPSLPVWSVADREKIQAWKNYLAWEESDPLLLKQDTPVAATSTSAGAVLPNQQQSQQQMNQSQSTSGNGAGNTSSAAAAAAAAASPQYVERVLFAYRKAKMYMRFWPEIWYKSAHFLKKYYPEKVKQELADGAEACPDSFLLAFALAEQCEYTKDITGAHAAFENLISCLQEKMQAVADQLQVLETKASSEKAVAKVKSEENSDGALAKQPEEAESSLAAETAEQAYTSKVKLTAELAELTKSSGIAWVMRMRFARRAEGLKSARVVFGKARKFPWLSWLIFDAAARMEYHCSANKATDVPNKIFELGLKLFPTNLEYIIKYLEFLINIGDEHNARALFERVVNRIPKEQVRALYRVWSQYAYMYSDLSSALQMEDRLTELFPSELHMSHFGARHTYNFIDVIPANDLGFGKVAPELIAPPAVSSVVDTETEQNPIPSDAALSVKRPLMPSNTVSSSAENNKKQKLSPVPPSSTVSIANVAQPANVAFVLPEVLLKFIAALPLTEFYDGPKFNADELIKVIQSLPDFPTMAINPGPDNTALIGVADTSNA